MRPNTKVMIATLLAGVVLCSAVQAGEKDWNPVFNGTDLKGWAVLGTSEFVVTNQAIRLVAGTGWLRSEGQYSDFVFELEWRALDAGYDSGIFIRAGTNGVPWPEEGYQVNLARTSLGALVRGTRIVVPAETAPVPLNTWVKFQIGVQGQRIWLDVNGERAWEYDKLDAPRGHIGIQAEGKSFEFRNLRVKEVSVR